MANAIESDKLSRNIMLALASGLIIGLILHYTNYGHLAEYLKPIGDIFIRFLKMMIVPLVLSSIFMSIVNLGTPDELGSMGVKAIGYYFATTAIAAFLGLIVVNIVNPGIGINIGDLLNTQLSETLGQRVGEGAERGLIKTIFHVIVDAIPSNPFGAMADTKILQVITFAVIFGAVALFNRQKSEPLIKFMEALEDLSMKVIHVLMRFAPLGIFVLMLGVISGSGLDAIKGLAKYMITVIIGLGVHFCVLLLIACWRHKKSPIFVLKAVVPAMLTAFSTASSAATLPITMAAVEDNLGIEKKTAQFVLPLGATINMDGTALYESVAVIFIGQIYGIEMTLGTQLIIFFTASIAAVGAAAIPSAGLVTMSIVLTAVDFPLEGIGLILAVDRFLDMFRTSINVFGDCVGCVVVSSFSKNKPDSGGN